MNHLPTKIMHIANRWFWRLIALLIIGMVILIVIGRQTIGGIDQLRPTLQTLIAENIDMEVRLGPLRGEWPRLVPILEVDKVEVITEDTGVAISLDHGRANLDVFNSLRFRSPIWREFSIDQLTFDAVEDRYGNWSIKGFEGKSQADLTLILDPLFYSRLIHIQSVVANLQFFSGKQIQVHSNDVRLENDSDFHRAELSLRLSDQDVPAYLLLEGFGDPADLASFHADGYLRLSDLNLSQPALALLKSLLPQLFANLQELEAKSSGQLWFDIHPGGGLDFEGELVVSEVPLNWLAEVPPLENISTEITGWFTPSSDWGLRLQDFNVSWSKTKIKPLDLVFNQRLGSEWRDFDISVNHVDLTFLTDLLRQTRLPTETLLTFLDEVRPEGRLNALTLGHNQTGYYASANLQAINTQAYKGAPAVKSMDGYIELQEKTGLFHLDDKNGFDVYFPKAYSDYLHVESAEGTVYLDWHAESKTLTLESEPVKTTVDAGTSHIMFSVEQQLNKGLVPEVDLVIGGHNLDARLSKQYLPLKTPAALRKWIETAVVAADVKEFAMAYRHGPPRNDVRARTTQILMRAENTNIDYHPDWPGLRDLDTLVLVDDGYVESTASAGSLGGNNIISARATYDSTAAPSQRQLFVDSRLVGGLSESISFLAQSPVSKSIGPLAEWEFSGTATTEMRLQIPMVKRSNTDSVKTKYSITTALSDVELAIPDSPISVVDINGDVHFSVLHGLQSNNISGTFWQRPLTARLYKANGEQKLALKADLEPSSLSQLVAFPWAEVLIGNMAIEGLLSIPPVASGKSVTLDVVSQLQGNEVRLPQPLALSAAEQRAMEISVSFNPALHQIKAQYGEKLNADLYFSGGALSQGLVSYDRTDIAVQDDELIIAAYVPTAEWPQWAPVVALFSQGKDGQKRQKLSPVFDLNFDYLDLATFRVNDVNAKVTLVDDSTEILFATDLADGLLVLDTGRQKVPMINLSRLSLPNDLLEQKVGQQSMDPRTFFALDLSIDQLSIGDKNWGSIAFDLRPEVSGAAFNNIKGELLGLRPGLFNDQPATEFFWSFDGAVHNSRLVGPVGVGNLGDMFDRFDIDKVLDSKSGRLVFDLSWQEKPWLFSRDNIRGDFQIELADGSFYKSAGGANGVLKLVSLFNFANWLRRLQLDFSDVVGQNLAFNELAGTLHFEDGVASLRDPLKMNMPSGRMSMAGDFDLVNETVDTRLVATLPVATNLPWVAALVGGLPAAAGVFVTSKLVEKQVDRLSSISYDVTGPWDDITVAVDKIFAEELKAQVVEETPTETVSEQRIAEPTAE
ncbi:MAG: YhdP family protein [Porticoccaceae bacterium]